MLIEQLFLEFANRDTECQPKFVVQTCSSADRGRWQVLFYFRLIKEEKENTEQWAEETESMEGRRSLGKLHRFKSVSSLNRHPASCPPSSGRSKPGRRRHSPAQEGDPLGIMTRMCLPPPCHIPPSAHWFSFLFVCFCFFSFYPEENQVHLLCSEI